MEVGDLQNKMKTKVVIETVLKITRTDKCVQIYLNPNSK